MKRLRLLPLFLLALTTSLSAESYRIFVQEPGVYRVRYEDLARAGLDRAVASAELGLRHRGEQVPIRIKGARFSPGGHFEFFGEHLRGKTTFYDQNTSLNVYVLSLEGGGPRITTERTEDAGGAGALRITRHLEQDQIFLRFQPGPDGATPDPWYWAKLTQIDKRMFAIPFSVDDLDRRQSITMILNFRGWSRQPGRQGSGLPDHRVEVFLNRYRVGEAEWDGQAEFQLRIPIDFRWIVTGEQVLELKIPKRRPEGNKDPIVDVALLDWMRISYGHGRRLHGPQTRAVVARAGEVEFYAPAEEDLAVFTNVGTVLEVESAAPTRGRGGIKVRSSKVIVPEDVRKISVVRGDRYLSPATVELDRPSSLKALTNRADHVIITHRKLRSAIVPLADLHRRRGLAVEVVDVQDVYDEFSDGILDPAAIRAFLSHARESWATPPRFVLLVGDASWDGRNTSPDDANYVDWAYREGDRSLAKNTSTSYDRGGHRNLIPTGTYSSRQGHAASDNWFVKSADSIQPEMAIGRFPVVSPEEVEAIVRKTIAYIERPDRGAWRRRVLWITNESAYLQKRSDRLARGLGESGYQPLKVYPSAEEKSNEAHQVTLQEAFDEGQLLIHFVGHGGRYIWRTGPTDIDKNHDLFTLDHLDGLTPSRRLPVVLSLSCYSAPFDHPTADSIGEKLLRLDGRGAIGVVAASWRNNPTEALSRAMVTAFSRPGTIGEAFTAAKSELTNEVLVETYNLLADPAVPIAVPELEVGVEVGDGVVEVTVADGFSGHGLLEWFDAEGDEIESTEAEIGASWSLPSGAPEGAVGVRVYVWNDELDGLGGAKIDEVEGSISPTS